MKDGYVFYSDYSKPGDFCDEAWSTLQMSMMSTKMSMISMKNLPPDIIPTIIDTIKINPKISLQELAGLTGKFNRTIQRIIKNSNQLKRICLDKCWRR